MPLLLALLPSLACGAVTGAGSELTAITSRQQLNSALERGPQRRMGFLSEANYRSVHTVLSQKVEPVYFTNTADLYEAVETGNVVAALISGVPDESKFGVFSTELFSPRSFQMSPGNETRDLMEAVDAAVVRTHHAGDVRKAERSNPPFRAAEIHTCRSEEPELVPFPVAESATGLLKDVLRKQKLRILAYGEDKNKPDWHQDGNYTAEPPTGFWPDYMELFMKHFRAAYGDDIQLERVWMQAGGTEEVLSGRVHMTEPYYIHENFHNNELKKWNHRFSCVVMGYEQYFFAKRPSVTVIDDLGAAESCEMKLAACKYERLNQQIVSRAMLNDALETGSLRKMGFLSQANYNSVAPILSDKVEPIIFTSSQEVFDAVTAGSVLAGLISGVPDESNFTTFSTDMISPRSFQLMSSAESRDLLRAIDAAVVRTHNAGELLAAEQANPPFRALEVHTCRADDLNLVPFPNASEATGLLKDVLDSRRLKVLAYGSPEEKPNWAQDGNYKVVPPTGFWPNYMEFWMSHFRAAYGNDIILERVWMTSGGTEKVQDGSIHMTEPYYVYENLWKDRPKKWSHEFSCVVMGYEQNFFARRELLDFSAAGATCELQLEACSKQNMQVSAAAGVQVVWHLLGFLLIACHFL